MLVSTYFLVLFFSLKVAFCGRVGYKRIDSNTVMTHELKWDKICISRQRGEIPGDEMREQV